MVKFILNKKSLMTFGKWGLTLFSLVLLGFFLVNYIIPILALDPPTQTDNITVSLVLANNSYSKTRNVNFTYTPTWDSDFGNPTNCTLWGNFTDET